MFYALVIWWRNKFGKKYVRDLTALGFEKAIINSAAYTNKKLVSELAERFGTSTIVGSIDVKKLAWKKKMFI